MQVTSVSVTFKKAVSDGNYGSESAEVTFQLDRADALDTDFGLDADVLLNRARQAVHMELGHSPNMNIRRALQRVEPRVAVPAGDGLTGGDPAFRAAEDVEDIPF